MPKQYSFRTTKATQCIEDALDSMDRDTRSDFIRNALLSALNLSPKGNTSDVKRETYNVTRQTSDVTPSSKPKAPEPTFNVVEEAISVEDLDKKLNSIYGGN